MLGWYSWAGLLHVSEQNYCDKCFKGPHGKTAHKDFARQRYQSLLEKVGAAELCPECAAELFLAW